MKKDKTPGSIKLIADLKRRVEREQEAHDEYDVLAENARIKNRFPHLEIYPSLKILLDEVHTHSSGLSGKTVLDYGCGRGEESLNYLEHGAEKVYGIDISIRYIEHAAMNAGRAGYPEDRYAFHVMDAHKLDFPDSTFDLVIGHAILHHLDPWIALQEIYRVLKPGGRLLLNEPLADNPLLKLFRLLTPHARTKDEKPFTGKQIESILQMQGWESELIFCGLIEAPTAMITSVLMRHRSDNALLRLAHTIEKWTHRHRILLSWNQYVLLNMRKVGR